MVFVCVHWGSNPAVDQLDQKFHLFTGVPKRNRPRLNERLTMPSRLKRHTAYVVMASTNQREIKGRLPTLKDAVCLVNKVTVWLPNKLPCFCWSWLCSHSRCLWLCALVASLPLVSVLPGQASKQELIPDMTTCACNNATVRGGRDEPGHHKAHWWTKKGQICLTPG